MSPLSPPPKCFTVDLLFRTQLITKCFVWSLSSIFSCTHKWRQRNAFTRDKTCAVCLFSVWTRPPCHYYAQGDHFLMSDVPSSGIILAVGITMMLLSFRLTICPRWWRRQDWGGSTSSVISVSSSSEQDNRRRMILQAPPQKQQGLWKAHRARRQLIALNWEMVSCCLKGSISSQLVQGEKESHSCPLDNQIHSQDIDSSTSRTSMSLLCHSDGLHQQEKRMTAITCRMTLIIAP